MFSHQIQIELAGLDKALELQKIGLARVHARRAIGELLRDSSYIKTKSNVSAMHILEELSQDSLLPIEVLEAVKRLQGGLRSQLEGNNYSDNPKEDVLIVLQYFVLLFAQ